MSTRDDVAKIISERIPLVHYPANAGFDDWSNWTALKSRVALKLSISPGPFGDLRGRHVFTYAGPCCYYHLGAFGDAALYFEPGVEAGKNGSASPFDSGSLEDEPARLQPFGINGVSLEDRWAFFKAQEIQPLDHFRSHFASWLASSYDDPRTYLATTKNRWTAGEPQRLNPPELLEHNGSRGFEKYGTKCGDRRAWTWEIRIEHEIPVEQVAILHIPYSAIDKATILAERIRASTGRLPKIKPLKRNVVADHDSLYEASGGLIYETIFGGTS